MDKKTRKLIESETRIEVNGLGETLYNTFALKDVLANKPLKELTPEDFTKFLTGDDRWYRELKNTFKDSHFYFEHYEKKLKDVIYYDRLYAFGCLREFNDLSLAIKEFVRYAITPLSNEYRYKQVKSIEEQGLLSNISLTALKIKTYNVCDNLRNEWGDQITRYCTNNDNDVIIELVEEECKTRSRNNSMNLKEHMSFQELRLLREKLRTGDKLRIYRGFSIGDTDRVRKGLISDGDLCYGTAFSCTLDERIAWHFAHKSICGEFIDEDFSQNRYYNTEETWYVPTDKYIETKGREISAARDKKSLMPIICEYECNPKNIIGFYVDSDEAEVIIKTEDVKIIRYDIPHSNAIAEKCWESINRSALNPASLVFGAIANGLTALPTYDEDGEVGYIFAETERVRDTLEELIDCGRKVDNISTRNAVNVFLENSVEIPDGISPFLFGDGLFEYMKNPTNIKRKKNQHYQQNIKKRRKWLKSIKKKGFS